MPREEPSARGAGGEIEALRQLAEGVDEALWVRDAHTHRLVFTTPACEVIWGRSRPELEGGPRAWLERVHPEDRPRVEALVSRPEPGGYDTRYRVLDPDGSIRWIRERAVPVGYGSDGATRIGGLAEDITPLVVAEAAAEERDRLRQVVDHLTVGVWIYDRDFSSVLYSNETGMRLWGLSRAENAQDPLAFLERVDPEDVPRLLAAMKRLEATELTVRAEVEGESRHLRVRGVPVRDASGEVHRVAGLTEDVTARLQAEQALLRSEARYRRLVESSPSPIYALDRGGCFTEVNRAAERLLGRSARELIGMHYHEVLHPEDRVAADEAFGALLTGARERVDLETRVLPPDGEPRLLSLVVTVVRDGGEPVGAQGIAMDVTAERSREQHLQRAERFASIGTLISGVAHELNNPLQAITGFADLLLASTTDADDGDALRTIAREARRASRIVSDLRLLARHSHEEREQRVGVDVNDVIEHIVRSRRYALETANIELKLDLSGHLPPVLGDPTRLEQVLLNLVVNAEQALTGWTGHRLIAIRTRPTVRGAAITVRDTGPGVPSEALPRLFDPFFTTKPPREGTGLGLSLVHRIVHEHGGAVHVESEPGGGAVFHVDLPRVEGGQPAAKGWRTRPSPLATAASSRRRVLIIDDEAPVRNVILKAAGRRGHDAEGAADGAEGLERVRDAERAGEPFDLIVSDLKMRGVSGDQLVRTLLDEDPRYRDRLVVLTGDPDHPDAVRLRDQLGIRVAAKPLPLNEVVRLIEG